MQKRWQSCRLALEEESKAIREKEEKRKGNVEAEKLAGLKLQESKSMAASEQIRGNVAASSQNNHQVAVRTPVRTPKLSNGAAKPQPSVRVLEVRLSQTIMACDLAPLCYTWQKLILYDSLLLCPALKVSHHNRS